MKKFLAVLLVVSSFSAFADEAAVSRCTGTGTLAALDSIVKSLDLNKDQELNLLSANLGLIASDDSELSEDELKLKKALQGIEEFCKANIEIAKAVKEL